MVRNESPAAQTLTEEGIAYETLDFIYERSRNFDTLAKNLAAEVKKRAAAGDVCYCVEGAVSEDRAAGLLMARGGVAVIEGVGKAAAAAAAAGLIGGYTAVSAYEAAGLPLSRPLVVYDLDDRMLAGDIKLALAERFGDDAPAYFFTEGKLLSIPLFEADRQARYAGDTALVLPAEDLLEKKRFTFDDVVAVLRRLRAPDGCPWDRVQTHESIRINAIEEAYELVDAIDLKDADKICEEAGDVLMQALFHTLIEEDAGNFTTSDMLTMLCEKLISRHTHVFGQDSVAGADGALSVWEKNKMTEKHQNTFSDAVNDVPEVFPALLRAQKIAKRCEKGGWKRTREEAEQEVRAALDALSAAQDVPAALGRFLYTAALLGYKAGGDCEQALLDFVKTVQARYTAFEGRVRADGKDVNALSPEERAAYMQRAEDDTRA